MPGILIALALFALFTLLAYNRFLLLRKSAGKALIGMKDLLEKRHSLIKEILILMSSDKEDQNTDAKELLFLIKEAESENPGNDKLVEKENKISLSLERFTNIVRSRLQHQKGDPIPEKITRLVEINRQLYAVMNEYNRLVLDYNNAIQLFPSNVFALVFSFRSRNLFIIPEDKKTDPPKLSFKN